MTDPYPGQPLHRRLACFGPKPPVEAAHAGGRLGREVLQGQFAMGVVFDPGQYLAKADLGAPAIPHDVLRLPPVAVQRGHRNTGSFRGDRRAVIARHDVQT